MNNPTSILLPEHLDLRAQIINHPLYSSIRTLSDLHVFMEFHVIAVWDFMMLLKSLQRQFTCVDVPWIPTPNAAVRRMINEIVLAEESDCFESGKTLSHFEFYVDSMKEAGANITPITTLLSELTHHKPLEEALATSQLPDAAKTFVMGTYTLVNRKQWHDIAAVFAYSREGLIPDMFTPIVAQLDAQFNRQLGAFLEYLQRHIELDGDSHGILAQQLTDHLCEGHPQKIASAQTAVKEALLLRLKLWDSAYERLS